MAARTLYPNQTTMDWSDATWKETDDLPEGVATKPVAGDTVIFTANSGAVQMDEDSADALAAFTLGGGTLDGNDGTQWELYVDGNVAYSAGTATTVSLTQGTGNLTWDAPAQPLLSLTADTGATVTLTSTSWVKKYTGTGSLAVIAQILGISAPTAAWWGTQVGDVGCQLNISEPTSGPGNDVTLADRNCLVYTGLTKTLTMDANLDTGTGTLYVYGIGDDDSMTLDMAGYDLACGKLTLGTTAAISGKGKVYFGEGTIACASIVKGNAANDGNELHFETATVAIAAAFDTSNIETITSDRCTIAVPSVTIESTAALNNTTWTLTGDTTILGPVTMQQTAGTTTLDLSDDTLSVTGFTHTAGTLTSDGDFTATLDGNGSLFADITSTYWIDALNAVDGTGNTNLRFPVAWAASLGRDRSRRYRR